ncbi:hypothetical protein FCV25MIE_10079 [Fagus crenata]
MFEREFWLIVISWHGLERLQELDIDWPVKKALTCDLQNERPCLHDMLVDLSKLNRDPATVLYLSGELCSYQAIEEGLCR